MRTIIGKFHQIPLKTVGGVAETRLCLRTNQLLQSLHLTSGTTITGKFHQNPFRNIRGIAESRTSVDKMAKTYIGP